MKTLFLTILLVVSFAALASEKKYEADGVEYVIQMDDNAVFYALNGIEKGHIFGAFRSTKKAPGLEVKDIPDYIGSPFEEYGLRVSQFRDLMKRALDSFLFAFKPSQSADHHAYEDHLTTASADDYDLFSVCARDFLEISGKYLKLHAIDPEHETLDVLKSRMMRMKSGSATQMACSQYLGRELHFSHQETGDFEMILADEIVVVTSLLSENVTSNVLTRIMKKMSSLTRSSWKYQALQYFFEFVADQVYFRKVSTTGIDLEHVIDELVKMDFDLEPLVFHIEGRTMQERVSVTREQIAELAGDIR